MSRLNNLYTDVKTWNSPDYDKVRSMVDEICSNLKGIDLKEVLKEFIGKSASSREEAIQLIKNPILSRLENRFMYM